MLKVVEQLCMQQAGPTAYIEAQLHLWRSMTPQEAAATSAHAAAVAEAVVAEAEEKSRVAAAAVAEAEAAAALAEGLEAALEILTERNDCTTM